jgi:hypothetical protein
MNGLDELIKDAERESIGHKLSKSHKEEIAVKAAAELAALRKDNASLTAERNEWRAALQDLTPTGSEFTEPQECKAWVSDRLNYPARIVRLTAELEQARGMALEQATTIDALISIMGAYWKKSDIIESLKASGHDETAALLEEKK